MSEEVIQKKGMSKGCMISLIVAGVILIIVVALAVTCYMKREALSKSVATYTVNQIKTMVAKNPQPGIDTAMFNATADKFVERLTTDSLDLQKFQVFFQAIGQIPNDEIVDSLEAQQLLEAMYDYFPSIKPELPEMEPEVIDSL